MPELTEDQKIRYEAASVHHMWSAMRNKLPEAAENAMHEMFAEEALLYVLLQDPVGFADALAGDLEVVLTPRDVFSFWAYKVNEDYKNVIDALTDTVQPDFPVPTEYQTSDEVYELFFGGDK